MGADRVLICFFGVQAAVIIIAFCIAKKVFANKDEFTSYINDSIDHSLNRIKGITALSNKLNYKFKIFVCAKDEFDITLYGIKYIASTDTCGLNIPANYTPSKTCLKNL